MLRFALHRQGQISHACTRWHPCPAAVSLLVLPTPCRAWLSPGRPGRIPLHRHEEGLPPGAERPGFHPEQDRSDDAKAPRLTNVKNDSGLGQQWAGCWAARRAGAFVIESSGTVASDLRRRP